MSYCRICGDEEQTKYYPAKHNTLCPSCAEDTPDKVGRTAFEAAYWLGEDGQPDTTVPASTKREFWEDYRASNLDLAQYIEETQERVPR